MLSEILIAFIFFAAFITLMAVGVIFSKKELKGSCGGLGAIMGEDCMFCDKKDDCTHDKEHEPCDGHDPITCEKDGNALLRVSLSKGLN